MDPKIRRNTRTPKSADGLEVERERVRRDLERRGVDAAFAETLLPRVEELRGSLPAGAYAGVLAGVSLAYAAHREAHVRSTGQEEGHANEFQQLMRSFNGELQKLDEALQLLFAYLQRMRSRATRSPDETVH
jgi:hypothetical protein